MITLKLIYQTLVQFVRQIARLPQMLAEAAEQRQRQKVLAEDEVERLDRIRHPAKYRGK